MNATNARPGHPFEGDYPGFYEVPQRLQDAVNRQRTELDRLTSDKIRRAEIIGILRGRRSGRMDLPQLEIVPGGRDVFVAYGERLLRRESVEAAAEKDLLQTQGLGLQPGTRRRPDAFARVRLRGVPAEAARGAVLELAGHKYALEPNYIMSLAAVGKGIGGPEPIAGLGAFAQYPVPVPDAPPTRVAIIDTGIPLQPHGDGWLAGVQRRTANIDLLDNLPAGPDGFLDYQAGHGNFVAGVVQQVAPGAEIRVYRAADTDGFATDADVAATMIQAVDDGAQVINLSLGSETADGEAPAAMAAAVTEIGDRAVVVAAAGNGGDETKYWPAALPGVVAVAGLTKDQTGKLNGATWSSHGDWVEFSTIGEGIRSVFVEGQESPVFDPQPDTFPGNAWAIWTGTSFAAPQITGAIARLSQEQGISPRQAVDRLDELGIPLAGYGKAMQILPGL